MRLIRRPVGVRGKLRGVQREGNATYASSFDATVSTLKLRYSADDGYESYVPCVDLHGFAETSLAYLPYDFRTPQGPVGALWIMPDMRGRNGCSGSQDASGRELLDAYDAIAWARATFPCDPERAGIHGGSGGGGNVHCSAGKMPDVFSFRSVKFGMSDYGESDTDSWYTQAPSQQATLDSWVGSPRSSVLSRYRSRNATRIAPRCLALDATGHDRFRIYHDELDAAVDVTHSRNMSAALLAAGVRHTYKESHLGDPVRYLHGYPHDVIPDLLISYQEWIADMVSTPAWTVPLVGSMPIGGYVLTKRFQIFLGPSANPRTDVTHGGLEHVVELAYDYPAGEYLITPESACYVDIVDDIGRTVASTHVTVPTLITIA